MTQLKRDGFKTKVVEGVYHGQTEKSILVLLDSKFLAVDLGYLKNYGMIFDQESILFVDADRKAEAAAKVDAQAKRWKAKAKAKL